MRIMIPPPTTKGPTCAWHWSSFLTHTLSNPHVPRKIIHPILLGKKPKLRDICGLLKGSESESLCHVNSAIQARTLEWGAFPFSGDLPNPGMEPKCPALWADSLPAEQFMLEKLIQNSLNDPSTIVGHWNWIMFLPRDSLCVSCSLLIHTHRPQLLNTQSSTCSISKMKIHSNT